MEALRRVARRNPMGYYGLLALNRLRRLAPDSFEAELEAVVRCERDERPRLSGVTLALPAVREGLDLLRLGLAEEAWAALASARVQVVRQDVYLQAVAHALTLAGRADLALAALGRVREIAGRWPEASERATYEAVYPQRYWELIEGWATDRGLDPAWAFAVVREESRFSPRARSGQGACGLMQLLVPTARDLARAEGVRGRLDCGRLLDPDLSVRLGTRLLAKHAETAKGHLPWVLVAYHAGAGNARRWWRDLGTQDSELWVERLPFSQTRRYVKRVVATAWVYHWLRTPEAAPLADRIPTLPQSLPAL